MITAFKINKCMGLDTRALERAMSRTGYKGVKFKDSNFLGITNGKQFCYEVLYFDDSIGEDAYTKVFVDLTAQDQVVAEY